ncbi:MAG: hypothetical protein NC094_03440 [Bacteroidales bacterium]|nr:hypothetical protein [Lachnoclostridium sp.]MCM1383897.1 hypothetical protein [Lachnoclostridium sp.]MCM1464450.1 hypothetical protein [Bacteroidales bacterium]
MRLGIAIAGDLPHDPHIFGKIDLLIGQLSGYFGKEGTDIELQMIVSPAYTGGAWDKWNESHLFSGRVYCMQDNIVSEDAGGQVIRCGTPLRNLLGEAMCDRADALVLVWNEDVAEMSGATWELMKIAYDRRTPCIWISSRTKEIYCLWEAYYKKYNPKYLTVFGESLSGEELRPESAEQKKGKILAFWEKCSERYLKKYRAVAGVYNSGKDQLMQPDFKMEEEAADGDAVRQILLEHFGQFDSAAMEYNKRFRAMAYQKSILPFAAAILLAVGSYSVNLFGRIFSGIAPGYAGEIGAFVSMLAGIGLFLYGCLNYYSYRLSKSPQVRRWQEAYINNRYVAEIFRILIHFMPYGIELDLRKLCGDDRKLYMAVRHLADEKEPAEVKLDQVHMLCALRHVEEMLEDQKAYHEHSIKRYQGIVRHLEKWGKAVSYMGFGIALVQGCLQFAATMPAFRVYGSSVLNSFLSMLALLVPAWAAYFTAKEQQNGFRFNLENHFKMRESVNTMHERVANIIKQGEIPLELFSAMAGELAEMMLVGDTVGWRKKYIEKSKKEV